MNKKATDVIAYIGIIGWAIAYLAGSKEESKFHLNQALVLAIAEIVLSFATKLLSKITLGGIICGIADFLLFICWIIGFIAAIKGEDKEVPVLGGIHILN